MATLIHLNGPPGIGKSTLAALWADRHPGTLNLDIDTLHRLVGGWRDEDNRTHDVLRPVALAMAATHLAGGRDVVLPQFLGKRDAIEAFEQTATMNGARFAEVVLYADRAESIDRFHRRPDASEWDVHNRALVARHGGAEFLAAMHDDLQDVLAARPDAIVIPSRAGAVEDTYAAIESALAP
ncbi:MAG: AAA family ATPase [Propionicimonas sp.]|uniref:AAA family ATPase n=1 Tax=Propionicimonas sp. TaxID=1955623 RepID=UPI003D0CB38A